MERKTTVWIWQATNWRNITREDLAGQRKGNFKRKTVFLPIAAQNNPIMILKLIIIILGHQHGYPWPSLATPTYRSSLPAGPPGYTPYPHRATVCRFEQVTLLLLGHLKGSIGVHHLWARPYFSSSVLHVWFVSASIQQYRHDCCLEETALHSIG